MQIIKGQVKMNSLNYISIFLLLSLMSGCISHASNHSNPRNRCPEYRIAQDRNDTQIVASVKEGANIEELNCVLVEIADKHQFDRQRDYMFAEYLWVTIHLSRDGKVSKEPAAKLRRFVPPYRDRSEGVETDDEFFFSLDEAKSSL